jgi:hypothetical protein
MGAEGVLFNPLLELSAKSEDCPMKFCNLLQPQRAALKLLSIETEETAWGQKTSHGGVHVGIFLGLNFSSSNAAVSMKHLVQVRSKSAHRTRSNLCSYRLQCVPTFLNVPLSYHNELDGDGR